MSLIAKTPAALDLTGSATPHSGAIKLSLIQGVVLTLILLVLNSLLAAIGSLTWTRFPYWPAFMVFALVCAYFDYWGIILACLTPVVSSLLGIADGPTYMFITVNLVQAVLVLVAFRLFRIDRTLKSTSDILKYLGLVVILPSFVGAASAWLMRRIMMPGVVDPALPVYAGWWIAENVVPAIFPGIWLHRAFDHLYDPLARMDRERPDGWLFDILKYTAPWMLTILVAGAIVLSIVSLQASKLGSSTRVWPLIEGVVNQSPLLTALLVAFSIAILCSLASAIGNTKRAWILYQAICRHSPTRDAALRLVKAERAESKVRVLTIVFTDIRNFTQISNTFAPTELLRWLNTYFDRMDKPRIAHQGAIDKFIGDGTMLVFGLEDERTNGAKDAILYSLDMLNALDSLNQDLRRKSFPEIHVGVGIHTGPVIVGEIGSRNRVQDSVIGDTVNMASRIEAKTKTLSHDTLPVLLTRDTLQASGLLRDSSHLEECFLQVQSDLRGFSSSICLYAPKDAALVRERLELLSEGPGSISMEGMM